MLLKMKKITCTKYCLYLIIISVNKKRVKGGLFRG